MIDAREIFAREDEATDDEYMSFERIEGAPSKRPDLCAFLKLDALLGGTGDIVCGACHDEIFLDVDIDRLNEVASRDDIVYLIRCGVRHDDDTDSLAMFV